MSLNPDQRTLDKIQLFLFLIVCFALASVFIGYITTGSYMRYSGDDYCYSAVEVEHGFWQGLVYAYLHETTFAGNRFSLTIISLFSSQVGPLASAVLPGLVLMLWLAGIYFAVIELSLLLASNKESKTRLHPLEILLITGVVTFFSLYLAPNLGQSFYWRSGLLPYLGSMVFLTVVTGVFVHGIRVPHHTRLVWIALLLLSFFGAGFSEAVSAMQLGFYSLVLVGTVIMELRRFPLSRRIMKPLSAIMLGTISAMLVMVLSPANAPRQQSLPPPPGFIRLVLMSLENSIVFYKISLYTQFLPIVLCGLVFLAVAYFFYLRQPAQIGKGLQSFPIKRFISGFVIILVVGYLVIVCFMAPNAYAISSYPDSRAIIAPIWILVVQAAGLGWLGGWLVSDWLKMHFKVGQIARIAAVMILLSAVFFTLKATRNIYSELPHYQRWATFWDMRDAQIRQAKQENQTTVQVMEIDHIIPGVGELKADPLFWYNVCAARYYGLQRIYADQPGWDK